MSEQTESGKAFELIANKIQHIESGKTVAVFDSVVVRVVDLAFAKQKSDFEALCGIESTTPEDDE